MPLRARSILLRVALVVGGLAVAVGLLEGALRLLAVQADRIVARRRPPVVRDGRPLVLFAGDSNIYGLHVEADETLPAVAERLSTTQGRRGFQSVNRGRPGSPTWTVLEEVQAGLAELSPEALVVRAGVNNRITVPPARAAWWDSLRLVRLLRIARSNARDARVGEAEGDVVKIPFLLRGGGAGFDEHRQAPETQDYVRDARPRVREDLLAIAAVARAAGTRVYFTTYLDDYWAILDVDTDLEWSAFEASATLVDVAGLAKRAFAAGRRSDLIYFDHHPTPLGYELEARELLRTMAASGFEAAKAADGLGDPLEWLLTQPPGTRPVVEVDSVARSFHVRHEGSEWARVLLGTPGEWKLYQTFEVPIADTPLSSYFRSLDGTACTLTDGAGTVRLAESAWARLPKQARAVAASIVKEPGGGSRVCVSEPVDFAPHGD